ncbi:hypothetical protein P3S68_018860 [Capsicum galapagoense]
MKSQAPKFEQQTEAHNTTHTDASHPIASAPLHSHQQFPPVALIQPSSTLAPPNFPPPLPQQNLPYQVQLQNQFPQNPIPSHPQPEAYYPPAGQAPENLSQQYQQPAAQQHQTPPPAVRQQHQPVPQPNYSQPPPPQHSQPHLLHSVLIRHNLNNFYIRQPPYPSSGAPPSQQLYATPLNMFEPASGRPDLGYSGVYGPSSMPGEPYPYSSSSRQYGSGSSMKPTQASLPAMGQSGLSGYQQIPTASATYCFCC